MFYSAFVVVPRSEFLVRIRILLVASRFVIAVRVFFTVTMGYGGIVNLSEVSKGISKVPIMAPKNALLAIMITQHITYQCVI